MKRILLSIRIYSQISNLLASNKTYVYHDERFFCNIGTIEKDLYRLSLSDDSTFVFHVKLTRNINKSCSFIYSGTYKTKHDTVYLFKEKVEYLVDNKRDNKIKLKYGCYQRPTIFFEPWSSINLLFIEKDSSVQKISFSLTKQDYWSKTYNANTITKEKMFITVYREYD